MKGDCFLVGLVIFILKGVRGLSAILVWIVLIGSAIGFFSGDLNVGSAIASVIWLVFLLLVFSGCERLIKRLED